MALTALEATILTDDITAADRAAAEHLRVRVDALVRAHSLRRPDPRTRAVFAIPAWVAHHPSSEFRHYASLLCEGLAADGFSVTRDGGSGAPNVIAIEWDMHPSRLLEPEGGGGAISDGNGGIPAVAVVARPRNFSISPADPQTP